MARKARERECGSEGNGAGQETWSKKMAAFDGEQRAKLAKEEPAKRPVVFPSNGDGPGDEERARRHEAAKQRLNL